ncbi:putative glycolipid-binding domain-containing protein [Agromyces sp. ZXT2-3]|uniref:putative glycolipid-binding domain-containing protein n=1 Tax=Agromyces sp. ZXT2-3 TaxID=3461152 RepID=UPI004054BCC4
MAQPRPRALAAGEWRAEATQTGDAGLPDAGLGDPASVAGALDCDLGLCPLTNTLPIRRLGLLDADVTETPLVVAWVEVPSLRVIRSEQTYASTTAGGGSDNVIPARRCTAPTSWAPSGRGS